MKTRTERLLALLAVLALMASACGGSSESETASADGAFGPVVESDLSAVDNTVDGSADDALPADAPSEEPVAVEQPAPEVLAFAIQAAEELSYSYEQGIIINADMLGQRIVMGGDQAFATGLVNGDDVSVNADIGMFMLSMFESMGLSADDPALGGMLDGFRDLEMDIWMVDNTVVMDLSSFASAMGGLDPSASGELGIFMDGPISVDLDQLESLGGVADSTDAAAIVGQFGQGAQITDPADIMEALRSVDALVEAGSDTLNGVAVDVYTAQISFADYAEAVGQDVTSSLEQAGVLDPSVDVDAIVAALESVDADLTISLDGEGYVRELVTLVDMGSFLDAMTADASEVSMMEIEMVVETWQTFDNYGEDVEIVAPDAVDRTSELAGLLTS